jgi:hypothetical protein
MDLVSILLAAYRVRQSNRADLATHILAFLGLQRDISANFRP